MSCRAWRPKMAWSTICLLQCATSSLPALFLPLRPLPTFGRAPCPEVFGTDAPLGWGGVVRAQISPQLSAELWRRSEHGGWHAILRNRSLLAVLSRGEPLGPDLTQLHRDLGLPSLEPPVAPRWITELSEALRFRLAYKWEFRMPRHINILETTYYKSLCKYCCIRWSRGSRSRA